MDSSFDENHLYCAYHSNDSVFLKEEIKKELIKLPKLSQNYKTFLYDNKQAIVDYKNLNKKYSKLKEKDPNSQEAIQVLEKIFNFRAEHEHLSDQIKEYSKYINNLINLISSLAEKTKNKELQKDIKKFHKLINFPEAEELICEDVEPIIALLEEIKKDLKRTGEDSNL
jgi:hypothetical protein